VVTDKGFAYWHSATFNNDGTKVIFTDEWGGGARPRCRSYDPRNWGADAIYDIVANKLIYRGTARAFRDKRLRPGTKYHYTVTASDAAANSAAKALTVTATGRLTNPVPGEHVSSPPRLAWLHVKGASYYNVQLFRGKLIFSAWPKRASLKLPRSWVYQGHRYRLRSGVYRWYVWPGFGRLSRAKYGRLVGHSSFAYR
jgi:hypothetical protein